MSETPPTKSVHRKPSKNIINEIGGEDDWEVADEILVHVDVPAIVQCGTSADGQQLNTKFIGLDTDRPIVQIGTQVFSGHYEDTVGTSVFFKSRDLPNDPTKANLLEIQLPKQVEYLCKTNKKLVLSRVFLHEKEKESAKADGEEMSME